MRTGRRADGESHLAASARRRAAEAESGQLAFRVEALRRDAARRAGEPQPEAALAAYREVLGLSPGDPRSHRDLGLALAAAGMPGEAVPHLEAAQAAEPVPEAALALAGAYGALGRTVEREQQLVRHARLVEQRKRARLELLTGAP